MRIVAVSGRCNGMGGPWWVRTGFVTWTLSRSKIIVELAQARGFRVPAGGGVLSGVDAAEGGSPGAWAEVKRRLPALGHQRRLGGATVLRVERFLNLKLTNREPASRCNGERSSVGRAPRCGRGGRGFKSRRSSQKDSRKSADHKSRDFGLATSRLGTVLSRP